MYMCKQKKGVYNQQTAALYGMHSVEGAYDRRGSRYTMHGRRAIVCGSRESKKLQCMHVVCPHHQCQQLIVALSNSVAFPHYLPAAKQTNNVKWSVVKLPIQSGTAVALSSANIVVLAFQLPKVVSVYVRKTVMLMAA
ncbi:unnamed protein product [Ceratitis capitata]|uniref:(Mediterranean fruit fly) hypothetical protein n=1 Tax=Ceratitis capitata TaxID=7213 RepID=A0A811U9B5_CERCA|nr:unnamed protein product [Ceratitis capitata]